MTVDVGAEPIEPSGSDSFEFANLDFGDTTAQTSAETSAQTVPDAQPEQQRENPAWSSLKEKLPKEFHSQVDPILREWDAGVKKQFESYKQRYGGFDPFIEKGLTPDSINQALMLTERINTEPLEFFENMRDLLIQNGLLEEAEQVQEVVEELEEQEQQKTTDPRVDQLIQAQEQFQESVRQAQVQQAQREVAERLDNQIASELQQIESKVGTLPDWAKVELFNRAALLSEQQGRNVSLIEAYKDLQQLRQQMLNTPRPGAQAPRVVPSGGGMPGPTRDKEALKTFEGRAAAGAEIARRMSGQ